MATTTYTIRDPRGEAEATVPTRAQIKSLRSEASAAGDLEQVAICDRALDGDVEAMGECARVIRAAEAMVGT